MWLHFQHLRFVHQNENHLFSPWFPRADPWLWMCKVLPSLWLAHSRVGFHVSLIPTWTNSEILKNWWEGAEETKSHLLH